MAYEAARSVEHARDGLTETEALAVHAIRAGVPMAQVGRASGIPRWTVHALGEGSAGVPEDVDSSDDPACWPLVLTPVRDITVADVRRVYDFTGDDVAGPAPDRVLARKDHWYEFEPLRGNGPFLVHAEDENGFTLEWWQMQEHLPEHLLARCGDERRRRDMYEPPGSATTATTDGASAMSWEPELWTGKGDHGCARTSAAVRSTGAAAPAGRRSRLTTSHGP